MGLTSEFQSLLSTFQTKKEEKGTDYYNLTNHFLFNRALVIINIIAEYLLF